MIEIALIQFKLTSARELAGTINIGNVFSHITSKTACRHIQILSWVRFPLICATCTIGARFVELLQPFFLVKTVRLFHSDRI